MGHTWEPKPMLVCASLLLAGCAPATVPAYPPLDDAIAYVQLADPLSRVARDALGIPFTPEKLPGRERCPFNPATRWFECAPQMAGSLMYARSYQLLLKGGTPVNEWDATVASIRLVTDVTGSIATAAGNVEIHRHDDATLGDLRELRQTLTGNATLTWRDGASAWSASRSTTLQVMSRSRMPETFPIGTIEVMADLNGKPAKRSASMTFDGSPIVAVLLSFDGSPSLRCSFDLKSPDAPTDCD